MAQIILSAFYSIVSTATLVTLFSLSWKRGFHYNYWFLGGFLYNCFTISLFYVFLPIEWIESVSAQYIGLTFFILGGAFFAGLSFLVIPFSLRVWQKCKKNTFTQSALPLFLFFAFALQDCVRSLLVSLFLLGKESTVGLHFMLGSLGEALAFTPLVTLAYFGSVYFLTAFFGLIIGLITYALLKREYTLSCLSLFVVLCYFCFLTLSPLTTREQRKLPVFKIGIVTSNMQNPKKESEVADYTARVHAIHSLLDAHNTDVDLLILPESTSYLDTLDYLNLKESSHEKALLDSTTIPKSNGYVTSSLMYQKQDDTLESRDKDTLMAFSEYEPYLSLFLKKIFGVHETTLPPFVRSDDYHVFSLSNTTFGALLCSEMTSLAPLLAFEKNHPDFYVLQSNLIVMKGRPLGFMHLYASTRILSATVRKTVIGVSNGAPSYTFDGKGKLLLSLPPALSYTTMTLP